MKAAIPRGQIAVVAQQALIAVLRETGYKGLAELVIEQSLAPEAILLAFRSFSCTPRRGRTMALLVAVAAIVRFRTDPARQWNDAVERQALMDALDVPKVIEERGNPRVAAIDYGKVIRRITKRAAKPVATLFA